jgi:hypothetical protein
VIVRDTIPITIQGWNDPKKAHVGASFIDKRSKKDLWKKLIVISFYLRTTTNSMMMVTKFRVDVKGEGQPKISLSRRCLQHSGTTRKCYTRLMSRKRKLQYFKEHMRS